MKAAGYPRFMTHLGVGAVFAMLATLVTLAIGQAPEPRAMNAPALPFVDWKSL